MSRTALLALGYNVKIGDIQPVAGMETESQVECTVNEDLFSQRDAYQIHISSIKVCDAAPLILSLITVAINLLILKMDLHIF